MFRAIIIFAFFQLFIFAHAQGSGGGVFHPLYEFDRQFAKDTAAKANCAISVAKPIWQKDEGKRANSHKWKSSAEEYVNHRLSNDRPDDFACHWRTQKDALKIVHSVLHDKKELGAETWTKIEDEILLELDLFPVRSEDGNTLEYYGVVNRLLFDTLYAVHTVLPKGRRGRVTFEEYVAAKICPDPDPDATECKFVEGKAAAFRTAMESLFFEHLHNQNLEGDRAPPENLEPHVSIYDLFVEDLRDPAALSGDDKGKKFKYKEPDRCKASVQAAPAVRSVLNCSIANGSDFHILLSYKPNSSTKESNWLPVRSKNAPEPTTAAVIRNTALAVLDDTFKTDKAAFPSSGSFKLAKNPEEFLKPKTEEGITLSIGLDREGQEDSFEVDAAIGYRFANSVKPDTKCKNEDSPWCRVQISATPFLAWQREQTEDLSSTPADVNRQRDVVFAGLQMGFEQIAAPSNEKRAIDYWKRPSWRGSLALEAITDGDFDSQVYRAVALGSPAWPKNWPSLGYRQRVRIGDLTRSHDDRALQSQGAIQRCQNRLICSIWVEWDAALAIEEVAIDEAPFNLSTTDILDDRIFEFDGTRYGYNLSGAIGARAPFAFSTDKPWIEFKVDYKNRQSWTEGGGQADILETAINLKDTKDGLLSFGIGYERGEDLRLGNDIESWNLKVDLKR